MKLDPAIETCIRSALAFLGTVLPVWIAVSFTRKARERFPFLAWTDGRKPLLILLICLCWAVFFILSCSHEISSDSAMTHLIASIERRAPSPLSPEEKMAYREIVANIYGDLQPEAIIRLRDKLPSLTNTTSHVVDISIRSVQAGQEVLTVVNTIPELSPVDKDRVLAFANILSDVGATKGILVSNAGFTRAAISIAPTLGIGLASIQDAQSRKWADDIDIPVVMVKKKVLMQFHPVMFLEKGDSLSTNLIEWRFSIDNGSNTFTVVDAFRYLWDNNLIPHDPAEAQQINLDFSQWMLQVNSTAQWRRLSDCQLLYKIDETTWLRYFTPSEYTAIKDELSHNIETTTLGVKVGPIQQDANWLLIPDRLQFLSRSKGVLILFEEVLSDLGEITPEGMRVKKLDDSYEPNKSQEGIGDSAEPSE